MEQPGARLITSDNPKSITMEMEMTAKIVTILLTIFFLQVLQ
jgi:hypothetical protein